MKILTALKKWWKEECLPKPPCKKKCQYCGEQCSGNPRYTSTRSHHCGNAENHSTGEEYFWNEI